MGRAVVKRFLESGAVVHVPWIAEAEVTELETALGTAFSQVRLHQCDVTVEEQVGRLFVETKERSGPVEILANVVGAFSFGALDETDVAVWERMGRLNATSAFLCCRAAVPAMKAAGWGRIVNVSSAPVLNHGAANLSAYTAAKAAVLGLSESLARELAPWGITVNTLVPTVIDTPANRATSPGADRKGWLQPEEIADVIHFLASDAASAVSGGAINLYKGAT